MRRGETYGWWAGIEANISRDLRLYMGRSTGRDTYEVASLSEEGRLVLTEHPPFTEAPPLLYLPRGADVALAEALADRSPDAEWKARAEERQTALDREVARVDRILGEHRD